MDDPRGRARYGYERLEMSGRVGSHDCLESCMKDQSEGSRDLVFMSGLVPNLVGDFSPLWASPGHLICEMKELG